MAMYSSDINPDVFNITIDGFPLIIEGEPSPNESFNRRETARHNIIGGTQWVARTTYVPVDVSFTTHVRIDPYYPDIYDSTFKLWMSKNVEVISREFGNFMAECKVKKLHSSPAFLKLEIQLTEIPGSKSNIPNDEFVVPTDKITTSNKSTGKGTSKGKSKSNNTKKTTKKTNTKKNSKKNGKKKGSKITKTKK